MRRYVSVLKLLAESNIVKLQSECVSDVPEEVLRMFRLRYGIAFAISRNWVYFWNVGPRVCRLLSRIEDFSGDYVVGKDGIGFFWEDK
jgi:hypothetical protein